MKRPVLSSDQVRIKLFGFHCSNFYGGEFILGSVLQRNWKKTVALLTLAALVFMCLLVSRAESVTVYHETFASGKGVAAQSGGANLKQVTGKVFDGNDDGAALYVSNRVNNWDAADFKIADIGLVNGNTYTITIKGYVDADVNVPAGAQCWLQTVDSYGWWGGADFVAGKAFTLTGTYKADTSKDTSIRVQTNETGAAVPFYIGDIQITGEPAAATETPAEKVTETKPEAETTAAETEVYHETFASGKGVAVQSGGASLTPVTSKVFDGNDDGAALFVSNRTNNWDAADFKFADVGLENGKTYTITVKGFVDADASIPTGAQAWLQTVNSYGFWGSADFKAGEAFTLTGKYTVDTSMDSAIRVQSNEDGKTVPFYIGDIVITGQASSAAPAEPAVNDRAPAEPFTTITFEDNTANGFVARGGVEKLTITDEENHTEGGKYALKVEGREMAWHAPSLRIEKNVDQGAEYKITAWVKLLDPDASQIQLSTQIGEGDGASYINLAPANVTKADGWVKLEGTYRYNNLSSEYATIYVESANNATASFYIDDISLEKTGAGVVEIQKDLKPLKEVYENDFLIGTAISAEDMDGVRFDMLKLHHNVVTAANAMKPDAMQRMKGTFTFDGADKLVDKALAEGIKVHGHTLVWHQQSPEWLNTTKDAEGKTIPLSREEALDNLRTHITTVMEHFGNKVISWDVVNEGMNDNPSNPTDWRKALRQSPWYQAIGDDYIEQAFLAAREVLDAHPDWDITLYYNDYNEDNQNKATAIYSMVKELNEKYAVDHPGKLLIDGVGMQGHHNSRTNPENVKLSLEKFISLGVEVSITELDVQSGNNFTLTEEEAEYQAYLYAQMFKTFRENSDHIARVTLWGIDDGTSWRSSTNPLLFDKNLQAKPAYYAVIDPDKTIAGYSREVAEANESTALYATPVVDGVVDAVWADAPVMEISRYQMAWQGATGTAKALWDDKNLYVLIQVSDAQLDKGSANAWEQDSIEVFVDENNEKTSFYQADDSQFRVNYENTTSFNPASIEEGFESAVVVSGTNYTVEVRIPFRTITPASDTVIGFDVQINDGKDGARQSVATWNDVTGNAYQDTSVIGNLKLADKDVAKTATRGDAIVMILKAFDNEPLTDVQDNFSDAAGENAGYYAKAKAIGLTNGIGNNKVGAELPMTREMLYTMVYNMGTIEGKLPKTEASAEDLSGFSDYKELAGWSVNGVKALVDAGLIKGDKLNPKEIVTTDEVQELLNGLK